MFFFLFNIVNSFKNSLNFKEKNCNNYVKCFFFHLYETLNLFCLIHIFLLITIPKYKIKSLVDVIYIP